MQFYEVALLLNQKLDVEVTAESGEIQKVRRIVPDSLRRLHPAHSYSHVRTLETHRNSNQVVLFLNSTNAGSATLAKEYSKAPFRLQCAPLPGLANGTRAHIPS